MIEILITSGKGGTGKTSFCYGLVNSLKKCAIADYDVDASNLHLVLKSEDIKKTPFSSSKKAKIKPGHCTACGKCEEICQFGAISFDGPGNGKQKTTFKINPMKCEGCGLCYHFCAENAIQFEDVVNGNVISSRTDFGPFVYGKLHVGESNSGKLVSEVKDRIKKKGENEHLEFLVSDGSPGLGCPVVASMTGANYAVIVTEPSVSGLHDLKRVFQLSGHFNVPCGIVVNKYDINKNMTENIKDYALKNSINYLGDIPYDREFTKNLFEGKKNIIETDIGKRISEIKDNILKDMKAKIII